MYERIRCGIIGLGRIGSILEQDRLREKPCTHAGAIALNSDCVLAGGVDIDDVRREKFAEKWNCPHVYRNIGDMLRERQPVILVVATPPNTHLPLIESALDSSVRLVICEKPLARNIRDARKIAEFHSSGRVRIMTNHERRYSEDYLWLRRRIEMRDFGGLLSIDSKLSMGGGSGVGGVLLEDGTHLIDIVRFLSSEELQKLEVRRFFPEGRETLFLLCRAGEIPVLVEVGSERGYVVFELDLCFTRGRVRIGNGLYEEYESGPSPFYEGMESLIRNNEVRPERTGYFTNMLADAVRCVRDESRDPVSSALDGYRSLQFVDAVLEELGAP